QWVLQIPYTQIPYTRSAKKKELLCFCVIITLKSIEIDSAPSTVHVPMHGVFSGSCRTVKECCNLSSEDVIEFQAHNRVAWNGETDLCFRIEGIGIVLSQRV